MLWGTRVRESRPGVYVVALVGEATLGCSVDAEFLEPDERKRWRPDEPVVYIGQTTRQALAGRVSQFYRHKYGARSPHSGGEAVKLLLSPPSPRPPCNLWVYWSPAPDPYDAELLMICAFRRRVGQLPFANRG